MLIFLGGLNFSFKHFKQESAFKKPLKVHMKWVKHAKKGKWYEFTI